AHPFSWKHLPSTMCPLSKKEVTKRIDCIGGMLYYLLNAVPFNIVKTMGRWSSESFTLYLLLHALVLAPFLQHQPKLMHQLRRYILPPVW
ncbi:hypothetical protein PAXRUDRAFT_174893, partial [Paxillus rubicundulus Ve08.2h10]